MRVTVRLADGAELDITNFDADTVLDMAAELHEARFATFEMDDATVIVNTDNIVRIDIEDSPDPEPEPEPEPAEFPVYAHTPANAAGFWQSIADRPWADGAFVYYPGPFGHPELRWDEHWAKAVERWPEGLHTIVSPKHIDVPALWDFCNRLPQSWRDKMIFAYYQEPEDNHTTAEARSGFREQVTLAASIVRPFGIRNAVELQAWTLNPNNGKDWAGAENLAEFVNPADVDHISWSIYEYHLKDRGADQVGWIADFMARFPGVTWDASASGISVPVGTPADSPERVRRAELTTALATVARDAGATGFGWFDFPAWGGTRDYDVASDPHLTEALANLSWEGWFWGDGKLGE